MAIFAISDLHLSSVLLKPMDRFGPQWVNHVDKVRTAWLETVTAEDLVLLPGDLSWSMRWQDFVPDADIIASLPGLKIISRGNHDYFWQSKTKMQRLLPAGIIPLEQSVTIQAGWVIAGVKGWLTPGCRFYDSTVDQEHYLRERGRLQRTLEAAAGYDLPIIVMIHFPPFAYPGEVGFCDLLQEYKVTHCVYGHLHSGDWENQTGGLRGGVNYHLVSADYLQFRPRVVVNG